MPHPSDIHVENEAGRRHNDLGRHIERIARECGPLVEDITGLLLPPRVAIRLVTVGGFIDACKEHRERLFTTEIQELAPCAEHVRAARQQLQNKQKADGLFWLWSGAQTILSAEGSTEILMVPKGLRHAGRYHDDWWLHLALAHELCHPAQQRASAGTFITLRSTPFPQERGTDSLALAELTEGHAMWAGHQARAKLLGAPPAHQPEPKTSWLYRKYQAKLAPPASSTDAVYTGGEDFTTYVLRRLGTGAFNLLWPRLDLTPTHAEMTTPDMWMNRILPFLLADRGNGSTHNQPGFSIAAQLPAGSVNMTPHEGEPGPSADPRDSANEN
ncbi:hypothetical protein GCM10010400_30590 [Streptomyces aculeolatus]|uniref:hypothetical protein n=1 Tax=Streptomyces aculeolatus TaxID=270689 RepID=UPI001CEDCCE7|nr:hypothetical protein [Streptomyces aculeolatus]